MVHIASLSVRFVHCLFTMRCNVAAHQGRVTGIQLVEAHSWLLSCSSADKCFTCFSTETGQRLSGNLLTAPCTCLLYPLFVTYQSLVTAWLWLLSCLQNLLFLL